MKTCEWCGTEFEPRNEEQAYCKPTHSTKANAKRRRERLALENAGKCPTPYKRSYVNAEHAAKRGIPATHYLYVCRCGAIHSATLKNKRTKRTAA